MPGFNNFYRYADELVAVYRRFGEGPSRTLHRMAVFGGLPRWVDREQEFHERAVAAER